MSLGLRVAFLALIAAIPLGAQDWRKDVELACTHPRYGLRLAASRKVAAAGAEAVPAIRAFQQEQGRDKVPVALVEAIATSEHRDAEVVVLLEGWATDRDFFWRAQALRGLADRADPEHRELFLAAVEDSAWLTRVQGGRGLHLLGREEDLGRVLALLEDPDPRVRTKIAAHLLDHRATAGLPVLFSALLDDRTFLGDPWGRRMGREAIQSLKDWLGTDGGYDQAAPAADNATAVFRLVAAVSEKAPGALPADFQPQASRDSQLEIEGGIEVLSCRNGDLFLRWTDAGEVLFGLEEGPSVRITDRAWQVLERQRRALSTDALPGVVICDKMRLKWDDRDFHAVAAPRALPEAFAEWLKTLASALEETGSVAAADALRDRLEQFATPAEKD